VDDQKVSSCAILRPVGAACAGASTLSLFPQAPQPPPPPKQKKKKKKKKKTKKELKLPLPTAPFAIKGRNEVES
jgi:hypothetical protein